MTLTYGIFDVSDPESPDREYSAALLCSIIAKFLRDGIVHGEGDELAVVVTDPPAMTVQVGTGTAMVQGRFMVNDAALTLTVPDADATNPRIDRVVVQLNATPGRTVDIVVKQGTAAPAPAAPALTQTAETWELSLAQIAVAAGGTSILTANITDERASMTLCGEANPAYVRSDSLNVVNDIAMAGNKITGLGAPTADADAATKAYVNQEVSSFGLSDIDIDSDKDWQEKNISNVGRLDAHNYRSVDATDNLKLDLGDAITTYSGTYGSFVVPDCLAAGSVIRVKGTITAPSYCPATLEIKCGTTVLATHTVNATPTYTLSAAVTVKGGDQIDFVVTQAYNSDIGGGSLNDREVHCQMPDEFVEA